MSDTERLWKACVHVGVEESSRSRPMWNRWHYPCPRGHVEDVNRSSSHVGSPASLTPTRARRAERRSSSHVGLRDSLVPTWTPWDSARSVRDRGHYAHPRGHHRIAVIPELTDSIGDSARGGFERVSC